MSNVQSLTYHIRLSGTPHHKTTIMYLWFDTVSSLLVAPVVVPITPQYNNITIGQPIQLLVLYEGGYPTPNVTWSRFVKGVLMDALAVTRASVSGALGLNLTIANSTLEDDLMYVLTVNNTVVSVTLNFTVSILGMITVF